MYTGSCRLTLDSGMVNKIVTPAAGAGLPTLAEQGATPHASRKTHHKKRYEVLIDVPPRAGYR
jgi:hypothetical protein